MHFTAARCVHESHFTLLCKPKFCILYGCFNMNAFFTQDRFKISSHSLPVEDLFVCSVVPDPYQTGAPVILLHGTGKSTQIQIPTILKMINIMQIFFLSLKESFSLQELLGKELAYNLNIQPIKDVLQAEIQLYSRVKKTICIRMIPTIITD